MVTGPPYFSAPVIRLNACSLCFATPLSSVVATTNRVLLDGSMTGVPVMPISGERSVVPTSEVVSVRSPAWRKFFCHRIAPLSASRA